MGVYIKRYIALDSDLASYSSFFKFVSSNLQELKNKGELLAFLTISGPSGFLADKAVKFVWV